jgi:hypothetical protein
MNSLGMPTVLRLIPSVVFGSVVQTLEAMALRSDIKKYSFAGGRYARNYSLEKTASRFELG